MNRLQLELDRLYGRRAIATADAATTDRAPSTRALVLELTTQAGWEPLAAVWKGVQADLDLPAPAIAVSGGDGLQLWFSLASPIAPGDGERFLQGLRVRYLSEIRPRHVRTIAAPDALPAAPPVETGPERWSAFVTPDLASVFADTPWLEVAPTDDGQATILRALEPTTPAAFDAASKQFEAIEEGASRKPGALQPIVPPAVPIFDRTDADPERFLVGVMNDEAAPLALRIEAAKALLPLVRRS